MDTENEVNKIRWERWRTKQKTEREKTCFYCWEQWNQWNNWNNWNQWNQWNNWNNWSNWSDYCEDTDIADCKYITIEATLYKSSGKIKVHWSATCCNPLDDCGTAMGYTQHVTIKVKTKYTLGEVWQEKTHTYDDASGSGDDWFDVEGWDHETFLYYECYGIVDCCCFGFTGTASASCKIYG